jgi:hypothetical protein
VGVGITGVEIEGVGNVGASRSYRADEKHVTKTKYMDRYKTPAERRNHIASTHAGNTIANSQCFVLVRQLNSPVPVRPSDAGRSERRPKQNIYAQLWPHRKAAMMVQVRACALTLHAGCTPVPPIRPIFRVNPFLEVTKTSSLSTSPTCSID